MQQMVEVQKADHAAYAQPDQGAVSSVKLPTL